MKTALWKTHYYSLLLSFKQQNDYQNWHLSIARHFVVCDLNFGPDCDFMEIQSALARKVTRSQKNRTVTLKISLFGIYGSNIKDFQALPHAFPCRWFIPTFSCPWRAANDPSNFEFISYRNNLRRKLSIYFNETRSLLNSYSKGRLAAVLLDLTQLSRIHL